MPRSLSIRRAFVASALVLPLAVAGGARAGNLFDAIGSIFGGDPQPQTYVQPAPQSYYDEGQPLDVTVRPRRERKPARRAVARQDKEKSIAVDPAALDPTKNATWYLQDPTLRRGDIVVLKGEVLVFQGGRLPYSREDFASLETSKLSKDDRERIGQMAGLPAETEQVRSLPQKTASVAAE